MPWYKTVYDPVDGERVDVRTFNSDQGYSKLVTTRHIYGNYIYARNLSHARRLAKKRNIGESVVGECHAPTYLRASTGLRRRNWFKRDVMHNVVFMCYMALQSGAATSNELFGDEGVIHELFHRSARRRVVLKRLEEIEKRIPGYLGPRFR